MADGFQWFPIANVVGNRSVFAGGICLGVSMDFPLLNSKETVGSR